MYNKNQIFAAPLAGISDKPFRQVLRMFAPEASLVTEMISCHSLVGRHKNCIRNFDDYSDEGNIGAQIFGAVPELMADAAQILESQGAKWVDINMGCPVPKVATRAGAGAFLMCDHRLAGQIINAVVNAVKIPVSVKTRLGWDAEHQNWRDLVHVAADNGASWVTLHGRTRAQLYTGVAVHPDVSDMPIPVIANGDIKNVDDVEKVSGLGYSGVMLGRALFGRPWVLGQITGIAKTPKNVGDIVLKHLDLVLDYYGKRAGVPMFRKHLAWYSAGMPSSSDFRIKINQITNSDELKSEILKFWGCVANI
ncbi:MAG: tRNA-dihydrouridine synthase [Alphaproteobacteria bacterium]|nr:tRNA-dihydrouridine synthase [Alphaproteobacteria bacterium]